MIALEGRTGEAVVCAALLAVAIGTGITSAGMPMGSYNLPGPGVFPLALSVLLAAGAALRLGWLLVRRDGEAGEGETRLGHRNIVIVCLALAGVALGLERAGFMITAGVFLLVLYRAFSGAAWWRVIVTAAATLAGFHLFFERFIGITLPMGVLG